MGLRFNRHLATILILIVLIIITQIHNRESDTDYDGTDDLTPAPTVSALEEMKRLYPDEPDLSYKHHDVCTPDILYGDIKNCQINLAFLTGSKNSFFNI